MKGVTTDMENGFLPELRGGPLKKLTFPLGAGWKNISVSKHFCYSGGHE